MKGLHRVLLTATLVASATVLAGCATTSSKEEWDGLVRQPNTRLNAVFVRPDAEIKAYRSVMLDPVEVAFARNFEANRGGRSGLSRLDAGDLAAIRSSLAEMMREIVGAELARGGYTLVDAPGPDTLRVTAAIVDLYINAPDTMTAGRSRTYVADSGRMTLVAELRDSTTGELLARAVDTRTGRNAGTFMVANRVTNTADARRAMGVWATALRRGLDEMHGRASAEGG
jgi:hypothetical protein